MLIASSMSLKRYLDERQSKPKLLESKQRDISEEELTQYTDLEFGFELNGKQIWCKISCRKLFSNWIEYLTYFPEISIKIFKDCEELLSPKSSSSPSDETASVTEEYASATGTISTLGSVSELESIGLPKQLALTVKQLEMAVTQRTYDLKVSMK